MACFGKYTSPDSIHAFSDVVLRSFNAQAMLSYASLNGEPPKRIMGCGWIVATAMGATALNETMGGKPVSLGDPKMSVIKYGIS